MNLQLHRKHYNHWDTVIRFAWKTGQLSQRYSVFEMWAFIKQGKCYGIQKPQFHYFKEAEILFGWQGLQILLVHYPLNNAYYKLRIFFTLLRFANFLQIQLKILSKTSKYFFAF